MGLIPGMPLPIVDDLYNAARGNPDAIKSAYDQQIKASQASQQQLQSFLMGQKGQTLGYYAPLQHMLQRAYGTEGLTPPVNTAAYPGAGGAGPGATPPPSIPPAPPLPGGHSFGGR